MTSTQQAESAGTKLINIAELLENILIRLPERDLLQLQQVSQIKAVTDGSALLKQKLFLAPEPPSDYPPRPNPLLLGGTNAFIDKLTPTLVAKRDRASLVLHPGEHLRSLFACGYKRLPTLQATSGYTNKPGTAAKLWFKLTHVQNHTHATSLGLVHEEGISKAAVSGAWRKMLLFQPPVQILWIAYAGVNRWEGHLPTDATLGDLADEGLKLGW